MRLPSVPTTYRDPTGLFALEAMAAGVPVVQPDHGAFPELIEASGGGILVPPDDAQGLADGLHSLLCDEETRRQLGRRAAQVVHERLDAASTARATWDVCRRFLGTSE